MSTAVPSPLPGVGVTASTSRAEPRPRGPVPGRTSKRFICTAWQSRRLSRSRMWASCRLMTARSAGRCSKRAALACAARSWGDTRQNRPRQQRARPLPSKLPMLRPLWPPQLPSKYKMNAWDLACAARHVGKILPEAP